MASKIKLDWLRKALDSNFELGSPSYYNRGINTQIATGLIDKTQPVSNKSTGYIAPTANLFAPFLYIKDVGSDSDQFSQSDPRELRDYRISHEIAENHLHRTLIRMVNEEQAKYLQALENNNNQITTDTKHHAQAITKMVQARIEHFNPVEFYDEIAVKLQVIKTYLTHSRDSSYNDGIDQARDRGIALYEELFSFGPNYEIGLKKHTPTVTEKGSEILKTLDYFLLERFAGLRSAASLYHAHAMQDISIADIETPHLYYKWGQLMSSSQVMPDAVFNALKDDLLETFGKENTREILKSNTKIARYIFNKRQSADDFEALNAD